MGEVRDQLSKTGEKSEKTTTPDPSRNSNQR